jgi:hypothetical protein
MLEYLHENGRFSKESPLTQLGRFMCVYLLETEYHIDMGCGDWKMETDLGYMKKYGGDGLMDEYPGRDILKKDKRHASRSQG